MKRDNKAMLRERARQALSNLYHNATPSYPDTRNDFEADQFQSWFEDAARFEVEYIQNGGAYGNIQKLASTMPMPKARLYARRAMIERAQYAQWEKISQYGDLKRTDSKRGLLYQYGRGGRTLAPEGLIKTGGGSSFRIKEEIADDWNTEALTELVLVLESFNKFVDAWCKDVPNLWKEEKKATGLNRIIWRYDGKRRVSVRRYA